MPRNIPLRSQRILVLVSLLLISTLLHTLFCEWQYKVPVGVGLFRNTDTTDARILVYNHLDAPVDPGRGVVFYTVSGLLIQQKPPYVSILCGLIVPLFLLGLDLYLILGWRYQGRIERGLCPKCKYDLRGTDHESCPECGIPTSRARQ